jgi:hypothetical protein
MSTDPFRSRARSPRWKVERTLADRLGDPLLEHDDALVAIAAAFGAPGCAQPLWEWLDDSARPLFAAGTDDLRERAAALADLMTNRLGLAAGADRYEGLLLDHAVASESGHPLLLAAVGHEFSRRAGWPSFAAHAHGSACTVLTDDGYFLPIFYGVVPDALDAARVRPRCAHATTHALLTAIARHAPADIAASAERVRESLPIVAR